MLQYLATTNTRVLRNAGDVTTNKPRFQARYYRYGARILHNKKVSNVYSITLYLLIIIIGNLVHHWTQLGSTDCHNRLVFLPCFERHSRRVYRHTKVVREQLTGRTD